jgi:alkaline phosphatase D
VTELSRRAFLALGVTVVVAACTDDDTDDDAAAPATSGRRQATTEPAATSAPAATTAPATTTTTTEPPPTTAALAADPFTLGVNAGDPDATSVVLWTRLVGEGLPDDVEVVWETSSDDFATVARSGTATASSTEGHSVHAVADVAGPISYRFRAGGFTSPVGRAAPAVETGQLKLAAASCQHFETGYYAAHRDLAAWAPDAVVFLGDFIYEGAARPVGGEVVRSHDGPEPTDLAGYRGRYAQYLADPDLQAARAACPWWVVWDDHEVENNYAGLVPSDPAGAADFPARRLAAYQAFWEHMPLRIPRPAGGVDTTIYRHASYGALLDLVLLDGRQFRSDQACGDVTLSLEPACPEASDPSRTMLGTTQEQWTAETLAASSATWTVIGQQTVLSDLRLPNGAIVNEDQWDGYAPARDRLVAAAAPVARKLVVLTGDIHLAGVGRLPGSIGTEFVSTSISSLGRVPANLAPFVTAITTIVDAELFHRGYTRHTITPATWSAEYRTVDDATKPDSPVSTWRTFTLAAGASDAVTAG